MLTSIGEKVLAVMLGATLIAACGSLWYADHEHGLIAPLQLTVKQTALQAAQAIADRNTAIQAASDAQAQLKIANDARDKAQASAAQAAAAASSAHAKLVQAAQSKAVAAVLEAPLDPKVWGAISNQGQ